MFRDGKGRKSFDINKENSKKNAISCYFWVIL